MDECTEGSLDENRFGWEDYAVFGAVLLVSIGIGVFHGCFKGRQKTASEFLMGNREINFWTLGASLTVG
jgi:solute carrier family 5 (sodium-coupled monocarboxylate transporter), member 8/12